MLHISQLERKCKITFRDPMRIFLFPTFICFSLLFQFACLKTELSLCDDSNLFEASFIQGLKSRKGASFCGYLKRPLPTASWTRLLGASAATTQGSGVTADASGNVYVTGFTNGNLDGNTLIGSQDVFLTKYDTDGNKLWTKTLGAAGTLSSTGITSDTFGNIYILGSTSVSIDGQPFTGTSDFFLSKYDPNGNRIWTRLLGPTGGSAFGQGITLDSLNNIYIAGYTNGNLDGNVLIGLYDLFLTKYDSNGNKQWTRTQGVVAGHTQIDAITLDSSNSVYLTGYTTGNLDGNTLAGAQDLIVVKYDSNGNKQWTAQLGVASGSEIGNGITTDMAGNIYATGNTNGNLDGQTLIGTFSLFIVKYDNRGVKQWTRLLGAGGAYTYGIGITFDSLNNVFVTGNTSGNLDGNTLTGAQDFYLTKFDSNGVKQFTQQTGVGGFSTNATGVTSDYYDNIYKVGYTPGNLNGQIAVGTQSMYIVKN